MAGKTGNGKIHGTTRLVPAEEFEIERKYLLPYYGEPVPPKDEPKEYHVRKDNTVRYRTNYYSVPSGTYRNLNTVVWLLENNGHIELYDKESGKLICRHELCPGKGKNVCDKRHHKDKTRSVNDLQVRSESGRKMTPPLFCGSGIWKGKSRVITGTI